MPSEGKTRLVTRAGWMGVGQCHLTPREKKGGAARKPSRGLLIDWDVSLSLAKDVERVATAPKNLF